MGCDLFHLQCATLQKTLTKPYIYGTVTNTLSGELDPHVLGDGGIVLLRAVTKSKNPVTRLLFEPVESGAVTAFAAKYFEKHSGRVFGVEKSSIETLDPEEREVRSTLRELATNVMGLEKATRVRYFEWQD